MQAVDRPLRSYRSLRAPVDHAIELPEDTAMGRTVNEVKRQNKARRLEADSQALTNRSFIIVGQT
jgi:hypothetical protein